VGCRAYKAGAFFSAGAGLIFFDSGPDRTRPTFIWSPTVRVLRVLEIWMNPSPTSSAAGLPPKRHWVLLSSRRALRCKPHNRLFQQPGVTASPLPRDISSFSWPLLRLTQRLRDKFSHSWWLPIRLSAVFLSMFS
jgi:hypothetical protein